MSLSTCTTLKTSHSARKNFSTSSVFKRSNNTKPAPIAEQYPSLLLSLLA